MTNPDLPDSKQRVQQLLKQADTYIRANPVPTLLGAIAAGLVFGLLTRAPAPRPTEPIHDALHEIRALLASGKKKGAKAYAQSAEAVREALEQAAEKAREVDVRPIAKWWKKLWA